VDATASVGSNLASPNEILTAKGHGFCGGNGGRCLGSCGKGCHSPMYVYPS